MRKSRVRALKALMPHTVSFTKANVRRVKKAYVRRRSRKAFSTNSREAGRG